jgi:hypothetical protein
VGVDHDGGLRTTYEPVAPAVSTGDQVYKASSSAPSSQVTRNAFWRPACTVRRGEDYLDPLTLIEFDAEIRLKPWEGEEYVY